MQVTEEGFLFLNTTKTWNTNKKCDKAISTD